MLTKENLAEIKSNHDYLKSEFPYGYSDTSLFMMRALNSIPFLLEHISSMEKEADLNKRKQDKYVEESFKILEEAEHKSAVARTGLAMLIDYLGEPIHHENAHTVSCDWCNSTIRKYNITTSEWEKLPHSADCVWAITTDILSKL